ncbi:MAG: winged helix-turn-helix transcriptional regulator [Thaumarchaeota archaeon]|nr:winged helix-turn-helix transcriptional regulator [Nitrososphaerota archaeon]
MESNEKTLDSAELEEKIEILSTEDDKIKSVGELLSNDSSRNILKTLLDDTMTANQIAQKLGISLPLTIYHLKKMQEIGMVNVTTTKEDDTKYYTSAKFAFIITSAKVSEKARTSKSLFNSLKRIYRFAAIGFSGLVSWLVLQNMNLTQNPEYSNMKTPVPSGITAAPVEQSPANTLAPTIPAPAHLTVTAPPYMAPVEPSAISHEILAFVIPLVIIIAGLVIERILRAYKK